MSTSTNANTNTDDMELIECEVCLKEIPKSGAKSDEASEYIRYFCGLDCYEKWQKSRHHDHGKSVSSS